MKRYTFYLYMATLLVALSACTDDAVVQPNAVGDEEGWGILSFGHRSFEEVTVNTRYTLSEVQESLVNNLFVYIFSPDGQRIYSHYFDADNLKASTDAVTSANENCWYVANRSTTNDNDTQGTLKLKAPTVSGGKLYLVANVNDATLRLSAEKLNTVRTIDELNEIEAFLAEDVTARTPSFPMVAEETVNITESNGTYTITLVNDDSDKRADLVRLDAKVEVNIGISNKGNTTTTKLNSFTPATWRVMNLPRRSNLTLQTTDYEEEDQATGYFDSHPLHFEGISAMNDSIHCFSFYMLENREEAKKSVSAYHARDLRIKNADGTYNTDKGLWENAPELGTYMVIEGELQMTVNPNTTNAQLLTADVIYYIHLGDIGTSVNNYNVERNTHYTYNITIKGVNSIAVEVKTSDPSNPGAVQETQPGATGDVYSSVEELYTFDAHYGQRVYTLNANNMDVNQMTWYVKTPFGREGTPEVETGTDVPTDLDYKWVHFMLNEVEGGAYSKNHQWYPGDESTELMDVLEFSKFLREEWTKWESGVESVFLNDEICVTAFVDEFYYEEHPITGATSETLWKQFVNQPNRLMHLLCQNQKSLDQASSATSSIITIRQRSIQTPYDPNIATLKNAWGCETVDEYADSEYFFYSISETLSDSNPTISTTAYTSRSNGLYNTYRLLGITLGKTRWDEVIDAGETYSLKSNYATLLYSTLMRNRDNNGNGVIDAEELRWYIASIEQLYGLYIGELGMDADARLYRPDKANATGTDDSGGYKWREHVVSSTKHDNLNRPIVLWAEEGVSTSYYKQEMGWSDKTNRGTFSIRCTRNLGLGNHPTSSNIGNVGENVVSGDDELIQVTPTPTEDSGTDVVYTFDLMNVNENSMRRIYYDSELPPSDEDSKLAAPYYKGFVTGGWERYTSSSSTVDGYDQLKPLLENGGSPNANILTDHYRVPNIREIALMYAFCPLDWWNVTTDGYDFFLSTTYYSIGAYGTGTTETKRWLLGNNGGSAFASLDKAVYGSGNLDVLKIRYVKDIE